MDTGETNAVAKQLASSFLPPANIPHNSLLLLLLSRFSHVRLCETP